MFSIQIDVTFSVNRQYYIQCLQAVLHLAFTGSITFTFTGSITFSFYRQSLFTVGILAERCRDVRDCTITTCPSNSTHIACHAERCTCDAVIRKIQPSPLPPRIGFLNIFSNKISFLHNMIFILHIRQSRRSMNFYHALFDARLLVLFHQ